MNNSNHQKINNSKDLRALEYGASIGRILSGNLMQRFHYIDLVKPIQYFIDKAKIISAELKH